MIQGECMRGSRQARGSVASIQTRKGQRTMRMDPARGGSVDMSRTSEGGAGEDPGSQGAIIWKPGQVEHEERFSS